MSHINLFLTCHKDQTLKAQINMFALQNLSISCMWKNIRKQFKNNKLKVIAPMWNDELELKMKMVFIMFQKFQNIPNISLKSVKY